MSEQNTNNDREHAIRLYMELNGISNPSIINQMVDDPINNLLNSMQIF